jgi:hypothetical protein
MKRLLFVTMLLLPLVFLVGCGSGSGEDSLIVGVWESNTVFGNNVYEFNFDGTVVVTLNGNADRAGIGTWSVNDNRLSLSRTSGSAWFAANSYTFSFRDDVLILRESNGHEVTLTRVG